MAGAERLSAQDLYVGSNTSGQSTNFTSGTNSYANTYVGYDVAASNNLLTIGNTNTLLTNSGDLYVGKEGASNSMVISNGASVVNSTGYVGYGGNASNNSVLVMGSNSHWSNNNDLYISYYGSSNSLQIAAGGSVSASNGIIGFDSASSNNSVVVTGGSSSLTLSGKLYVGQYGSSNTLVVSNQGSVLVGDDLAIALDSASSNNSVVVTDAGSSLTVTNGKSLNIGWSGSSNGLIISNGASATAATVSVGVSSDSVSNSITVGGGSGTSSLSVTGDLNVGYGGSGNTLTISTNGLVSATSTKIGGDTNANGNSVILSGGALTNSGDFRIGYDGASNSLVIGSGTVSVGTNGTATDVGLDASSSNNSVLVAGSNSLLQIGSSSRFALGYQGSGNSMVVSNGGRVAVTNSDAALGFDTGSSNNSLTITGTGSVFSNALTKTFYIGRLGGSNTISVLGGGTLVTGALRIGASNSSSNNLVLISDSGSVWTNSGKVYIGRDGSYNSLVISNSGSVLVGSNLYVGYGTNSSNNSILVTGTGSSLSADAIVVGLQGVSNSLTVANGGGISTPNLLIGATNRASGTVNIGTYGGSDTNVTIGVGTVTFGTGTGTLNFNQRDTLTISAPIVTLAGGTSSLNQLGSGTTILSGSNSISSNVLVDGGQLVVTGSLSNAATLYVGKSNSSVSLVISNALVQAANSYIGYSSNSVSNSVLVTGSNAVWTNSSILYVGNNGSGNSLAITNNGAVVDYFGIVGNSSNSYSNTVTVTGSNSAWTNLGGLFIGNGGGAGNSLVISNGATVVNLSESAPFAVIGYLSSNNSVVVTGSNSTWSNSIPNTTPLQIGQIGNGNSLIISDGGRVIGYNGEIGSQLNDFNNYVLVTGSNSIWTNAGNLYVGTLGFSNSMVISNQGTVSDVEGVIGYGIYSAANNLVTVTGTNSLWTNSADLTVGNQGAGNTLVISNGAQVVNQAGFIGNEAVASNNSVLLMGEGSLWSNAGDLHVGNHSASNSLVISNGAQVVNQTAYIGNDALSSSNSAVVTGSNSVLYSRADLILGNDGSGNTLLVTNGGNVINNNGFIGNNNASSNNSVVVTGSGSTWSNSGSVTVGNAGSGTLTVANSGSVIASSITIASQVGALGTVNIGAFGGTDSAGSITVPTIAFGSGSGAMNFNQTDTVTISATITDAGSGAINQFGSGTTILTGSNIGFSGFTTITNGTLQFGDGTTTGGAPVAGAISNNASLVFAPSATDTYTVAGNISGNGNLTQIGSGTTILSGSNSYTGTTLIANGTLQADSINALGISAVTLTNSGMLALSTNVTISSLVWSAASTSVAISNLTNGAYLYITGALTLTGIGTFNLTGDTLGSSPVELMAWGSGSYGTNDFSITGLDRSYTLTISNNNSLYITEVPAIGDLYVGSNSSVSPTNFTTGTNTYSNTYVGYTADASNNLLTIGNTNTLLTNSANLYVGYAGSSNSMVISNGGVVLSSNGYIGFDAASSNNTVVVTGSNSLWSNSGYIYLSGSGGSSNSVILTNGGQIVCNGSDNVGSGNTIIVTGTGSFWTNGGNLYFGDSGNENRLLISNGGSLALSGSMYFGYVGSGNTAVITDTNSSLVVNGDLDIGAYGAVSNTLTISNGGRVSVTGSVSLGVEDGDNVNTVTVTGPGSMLTNASDLYVGYAGSSNSMVISNGGVVVNSNGYVGYDAASSNNSVTATGANSHWSNAGDLLLGYNGSSNSLSVNAGAGVSIDGNVLIGRYAPSSKNTLTLDGEGTGLTNSGTYFNIGQRGNSNEVIVAGGASLVAQSTEVDGFNVGFYGSSNRLVISNGGKVSDWFANIGWDSNSSGNSAVVTGSGSSWSNEYLVVGHYGTGNTLLVSNGGTVVVGNYFGVGAYEGTANSNTAIITGLGSSVYVGSEVDVGGENASGSLLALSNQAILVSGTNTSLPGGVYIGAYDNFPDSRSSSNTVIVTGGAQWTNVTGNFYVGQYGVSNALIISNGGAVINEGDAIIGDSNIAIGNTVTVTGSGSILTNSGDLYVGYAGSSNRMVISNGASVYNGDSFYGGVIGLGSNSDNNSVLVTGSNSLWSNSLILRIGNQGSSNSLVISNQGTVLVGNFGASIGNGSGNGLDGNANQVIVTGSNTLFDSSSGGFTIGNYGNSNVMIVSSGARLLGKNDEIGSGYTNDLGVGNSLIIIGSQSLYSNSANLYIGSHGTGSSLVISNGGHALVSGDSYLGRYAQDSNNRVVVEGSNSLFSNAGKLIIGNSGSGSLTVANGGLVAAASITIASNNGSVGTLNIGSLGASDTAGTITTPTITFGSGTGMINFNQINTARVTSSITSLGTIRQLGTGTTILSGNNTYTGTTLITSGTLQAASTNALGTSVVTLTNSGTLSLSTNLSISSLIWDSTAIVALPGAASSNYLTVTGAVSLTGSGTNTFDLTGVVLGSSPLELFAFGTNGFTTNQFGISGVSDYLLSISNNALWIAINGLIASPTNTIVTNTATYPTVTFLTNGILTVTPTADLSITTPVNVTNNGTVVLNGVLNTPSLSVAPGGALGGTGTLNGNLTNNGVVAPGNSPGIMTVNGNYTQAAGGTLQIQVGNGLNSLLSVSGTASLGGILALTPVDGHQFQYGDKIVFLSASEITGNFSSVEVPTGFRGRVKVFGDPQLEVIIAPASYTQLAANRNQLNVATALNSFIPATGGDQLVVSTSLDSLTASQYNQAFNAIMPTFYQQMATIAFNQANAQNMELNQRLWGVRVAEGGGFSMSGLADNYAMLQEGQGDGGKSVLDSKKDILRPGLDNRWGMFVDGNGIFAQANSANMLPGYNSESGGVTTGLTYKWNDKVASGIYAGYQGTYTKSGANGSGLGTGSSLTDNAVRFGVFGTYGQKDGKGLYLNGLAGGAYHNYQATRVIQYTGVNRTANSAPGTGELDSMLATGYDIQKGKFTFGPTASLQYTYLGANGVNETGAQSLNFNSGGWNSSSMLSSVGAHAAYNWQAGKDVLVVPQLSLNWQHEFMQNPYAISGNLGGTSPSFSNWSTAPIRDFLYTGIGFTVEIGKKWNTSFFYNASAGNSDLISQNIFWSAGMKF